MERLNVVRDIFVFCAFTGLAFSDGAALKPEHISVDDEGNYWIHKARQKTKNMCSIPNLESARAIAVKYREHPTHPDVRFRGYAAEPIVSQRKGDARS